MMETTGSYGDAPKREIKFIRLLERLEKATVSLQQVSKGLANRLAPYLSPIPAAEIDSKGTSMVSSPMLGTLEKKIQDLERVNSALSLMMEGLEI